MAATPFGLLLSIIGLVVDRKKTPALAGLLLLAGGVVMLLLVKSLCR